MAPAKKAAPLTMAQRQARQRARKAAQRRRWEQALADIAYRATSISQARELAVAALQPEKH